MGKRKIKDEDYEPDLESDSESESYDPEMERAKAEEDDYIMSKESDEEKEPPKAEKLKSAKKEEKPQKPEKKQKPKAKEKNTELLDSSFNLNEKYFYQTISNKEWDEIKNFITTFLSKNSSEDELKKFFDNYPKIIKGNVEKLQKL